MKSSRKLFPTAAACVAALAAAAFAFQGQRAGRLVPYTVTWQMTEYYADGRVVHAYAETRSNYADGRWHSVVRFADGTTVERVAEPGRGVFTVVPAAGESRLQSPSPERPSFDAARHEKWARTEVVGGYRAEVLKFERAGRSHELYHAPRLNNDLLKTVTRDGGVTRVLEPTSIVLGEPAR